jgi:hypothetical protein
MGTAKDAGGGAQFSKDAGKKLGFRMDAIGWALAFMIDQGLFNREGGEGRAPLHSIIHWLSDPIWSKAAKIQIKPISEFVTSLGQIVKAVNDLSGGAKDFKGTREVGMGIAAKVDAIAWAIALLVDTAAFNGAGGEGDAPISSLTKQLSKKEWTTAQQVVAGKLSFINNLFTNLLQMSGTLKVIGGGDANFSTTKNTGIKAAAAVDALAWTFAGLVDTAVYKSMGGQGDVAPLARLNDLMKKDWSGASAVQGKVGMITTFLTNMTAVATGLESLGDKLKMTGAAAYGPLVDAVGQMMTAVADIDEMVSGVKDVDITTTLDRFKTNFGTVMGQRGEHVVQAKDVTINVNFAVVMETAKLEAAIVQREGSTIRDKINLMIGAIGEVKGDSFVNDDQPLAAHKRLSGTSIPNTGGM